MKASKVKNKLYEKIFINLVPRFIREIIVKPYKESFKYLNNSYSQEGEDIVLSRFFENLPQGFYLDIGAHHPIRYSNTYHFYQKGWRGINIDAMPGSMKIFRTIRPDDINLELAVSHKKETLTYYIFNEPALNGFNKEISLQRDGLKNFKIIDTREIETVTITEILDKHLPEDQTISFLSIDVEGLDLQILKSNDWNKYRPQVILVEDLNSINLTESQKSPTIKFLTKNNYELFAKTINTMFFKDKSNKK